MRRAGWLQEDLNPRLGVAKVQVQAEDAAKTGIEAGVAKRTVTIAVSAHNEWHDFSSLNKDELVIAAMQTGQGKDPTTGGAQHSKKEYTLPRYKAQSALAIKLRCINPVPPGMPWAEVAAKNEMTLNESLGNGWEVIGGKARKGLLQRRTEAGRQGATQLHRRRGGGVADAMIVPIGCKQDPSRAPIPTQLAVWDFKKQQITVIDGARDQQADFTVAGMKIYRVKQATPPRGFYPKEVGKALMDEQFKPQTDEQIATYEGMKDAVDSVLGGPCIEFLDKFARGGQTAMCHIKRKCKGQPCKMYHESKDFTMQPIYRLAREKKAEYKSKQDQRRAEESKQQRVMAERNLAHLVQQQEAKDQEKQGQMMIEAERQQQEAMQQEAMATWKEVQLQMPAVTEACGAAAAQLQACKDKEGETKLTKEQTEAELVRCEQVQRGATVSLQAAMAAAKADGRVDCNEVRTRAEAEGQAATAAQAAAMVHTAALAAYEQSKSQTEKATQANEQAEKEMGRMKSIADAAQRAAADREQMEAELGADRGEVEAVKPLAPVEAFGKQWPGVAQRKRHSDSESEKEDVEEEMEEGETGWEVAKAKAARRASRAERKNKGKASEFLLQAPQSIGPLAMVEEEATAMDVQEAKTKLQEATAREEKAKAIANNSEERRKSIATRSGTLRPATSAIKKGAKTSSAAGSLAEM